MIFISPYKEFELLESEIVADTYMKDVNFSVKVEATLMLVKNQ